MYAEYRVVVMQRLDNPKALNNGHLIHFTATEWSKDLWFAERSREAFAERFQSPEFTLVCETRVVNILSGDRFQRLEWPQED